ncbi:MAG: DUF4215 domain-containing protein [Kofleriaceae bacterium]|nr:DUF4215 domain-containing protein [Kofleriaceae bacterium]
MTFLRCVVPVAGLVVVASCGDSGSSSGPGAVCGDGWFDPEAEMCDYSADESALIECPDGYAYGFASCDETCKLSLETCSPICGDERLVENEQCDGTALGALSCESLGFSGGVLACSDQCTPDTSGCTNGGGSALIEVTLNGQPLASVPVAIANASGANVGETTTNASGQATYAVGADSIITIARTRPNGSKSLTSVADVDPGDTVRIELTETTPGSTVSVGSARVTFTAPVIGATNRTGTGCSSVTSSSGSATPHTLNIHGACTDAQGEAQLFAETLDGTGTPLGYHFQQDIPLTQGVPTDVTVSAWSQAYANLTCSLANAPAGDVTFTFDARFPLFPYSAYDQLVVATAGQTYVRSTPMPSAAFVQHVTCGLELTDGRQCSQRLTTPGTVNFDGAQFTTPLSGRVVDNSTPARPSVSWTAGTPSGSADFVRVGLFFTSGSGSLAYSHYAPPGSTTVTVPALPNSGPFAAYQPANHTLTPSSTNVTQQAVGDASDYKAAIGAIGQTTPLERVCSSVALP